MRALGTILSICVLITSCARIDDYEAELWQDSEPDIIDDFYKNWYEKHLDAAGEAILWNEAAPHDRSSYRFTWLRTFDNPVIVRIEFSHSKPPKVTLKVTDGLGGYDPGKLYISKTSATPSPQLKELINRLQSDKFWKIKTHGGDIGCDGAEWIIEGAEEGRYHVVRRWSPEKGEVRKLGLMFLEAGGYHAKQENIY